MESYDKDTMPTHEINYDKHNDEVYIYCQEKNCAVKAMIALADLWDLVELYSKDEKMGTIEGWFRLDCNGIYFVKA